MNPLLILLLAGIAIYIAFMLLVPKAVPEDDSRVLKEALEKLYEENRGDELQEVEALKSQMGTESVFVRKVFQLPFMRALYEVGLQAGFQQDMSRLLVTTILIIAALMTGFLFLGHFLLGIILSPILGYYVMLSHCKRLVNKRNTKFINMFPDALDMIVRSVRSGFPLSSALQMLSENSEEPVRSEFRQVVDDLALGRTLTQALGRLALRINEPDIRFFVVVLSVQQETGGNLAEIISNLSNMIRKRKQLRLKIRAMTSEGKATGIVLGALPLVVFAALSYLQPGYLEPFYTDPTGKMFLMVVVGLLGTCFIVVKKMINIDI